MAHLQEKLQGDPRSKTLCQANEVSASVQAPLPVRDSRTDLCCLAEKVAKKLQQKAKELSSSEARALVHILSGFSLATSSILKADTDTFTALRVNTVIGSSSGEPNLQNAYLDTTTMKMLYNPPFFPDDNIFVNYSTIWRFAYGLLTNYITPQATLQLDKYDEDDQYWTVTFGSGQVNVIHVKREAGWVELSVEVEDTFLYLVPIIALEGAGECEDPVACKEIVASPQFLIKDKNTFLWYTSDVTPRVDPTPVRETM